MRNSTDVAGAKLIDFSSQSISSVNANNTLFAFYDIYGRKGKVLSFFYIMY
jgi:hypothetical protein